MLNLIDDQPNRNSFSQFMPSVCVSLNARLWPLMSPSPAPKVAPASPWVEVVATAQAPGRSGELVGYGPVTAEVARRIAADGTWRRLLTDPRTGRFDELSVLQRFVCGNRGSPVRNFLPHVVIGRCQVLRGGLDLGLDVMTLLEGNLQRHRCSPGTHAITFIYHQRIPSVNARQTAMVMRAARNRLAGTYIIAPGANVIGLNQ